MTEDVSKVDKAPSDALSFWAAPTFVQALLGYGLFAYMAGYFTLSQDAYHYGFLLPTASKEQIVWAGVIPTIFLLIAITYVRVINSEPAYGEPVPTQKLAKHMLYAIGFATFCLLAGIEVTPLLYATFGERGRNGFGLWVGLHPIATTIVGFVGLAVFMLFAMTKVAKERWAATIHKAMYKRTYGTALALLGLTFTYVMIAFPVMPMRFGFGHPSLVYLVVADEYTSVLPIQMVPSNGKLRTTVPLLLMLKTEKEYVMWVPASATVNAARTVTIGSEAIKAVIWVP